MGNLDRDSNFWDIFWNKNESDQLPYYSWPRVSKAYGLKRVLDAFEGDVSGLKVLECGCGSAEISKELLKRGAHCDLLDISEVGLEITSKQIQEMGYEVNCFFGDAKLIGNLTGNKKYDLIYSGGLLHHIEELGPVVDSMKESLSQNGLIIADFIPDKFSLQTLADLEKSLVYFLRNIGKKKLSDLFSLYSHIPDTFVSKRPAKAYKEAFECSDLYVEMYTATVYPSFALPKFLEKIYSKFLLRTM